VFLHSLTWLRHLRENLKFNKPLNPHSFRHACATRLVKKGTQERMIREQMGWSETSRMIERYVHLAKTDLQTYQLMQSGIVTLDAPLVELIQPKETAIDRISKQEQEMNKMKEEMKNKDLALSALLKHVLELKDRLDEEKSEKEEEEIKQDILAKERKTEMSLDKIEDAVNNFDPVEAEKRYNEGKAKQQFSISVPTE
jgi:hypothetical protein